MKIAGQRTRSVWKSEAGHIQVFDQRKLPFAVEIFTLSSCADAEFAISEMVVRGAPLIGITAAFGLALQAQEDPSWEALQAAAIRLKQTRPTAVNLAWAVDMMCAHLSKCSIGSRAVIAFDMAWKLLDDDVGVNERIGQHGLEIIRSIAARKGRCHILTHCNAGWLATGDWGTALAPIYMAHDEGLPLHVYADETRPRSQGSLLTAFELREHGVPVEIIVDNAGGHLMQKNLVDLVIVGTDRVAANGDVANKIGTYLKALAAFDNGIPFYVACPMSTVDYQIQDGCSDIPIEDRGPFEVLNSPVAGPEGTNWMPSAPPGIGACNPGFDVTPARLVTGIITEHGIVSASEAGLAPFNQQS